METVRIEIAIFKCLKCGLTIDVYDLKPGEKVLDGVPCPDCAGEILFENFRIEEKPLIDFYCIWWDGRSWYSAIVKAFDKEEAKYKIETYDYIRNGDTPGKKSSMGYDAHYDLRIAEHENKNAMEGLFRSIWD